MTVIGHGEAALRAALESNLVTASWQSEALSLTATKKEES